MARILFLCSRPPYPPVDGARVRMYNLATLLAEDHDVDVVAISKGGESERPDNEFKRYKVFTEHWSRFYARGIRSLLSSDPLQCGAYFSTDMKRWVDRHVDEYDLVYCTHLATAKYATDTDQKKVIDFVDAVSKNFEEFVDDSSYPWRLIYRIESRRVGRYEQTVSSLFDACFITTKTDRSASQAEDVTVIPNGVSQDLLDRNRHHPDENMIAFLGDLSYLPNASAVEWFVEKVIPILDSFEVDFSFQIVGKSPPQKIRKLGERPEIEVTGFVDDPYDYVQQSAVSVVPVQIGGGIQNKVLESMALGTPVVTTTFGATGIDARDEEHFLVRDSPEEFANGVCTLFEEPEFARELSARSHDLIQRKYTWESIGEKLDRQITDVLNRDCEERPPEVGI
ncbi:sugar transferase, PEP-CTERM/EpsH1 system associated [Halomicrobium zhouii]|uniref:Sugar transferase, PEP-CTERM/EpsH1 system associated n=1 Tax=Halomicrobium zhouii TaxID=767519 RepID=A0A1I6K878_9EURY|nr:glycosyltransferase family 4 protein [Halomicrobium zhouii]SFR87463.1 sugar transferase, PEP-CTERM/EpsH1 system associated [Halomicrobium zhouii]